MVHWILNVAQSDTFVNLSFCPTQIRVHSSRPPHDELPLAICFLFICLKNLVMGPPRRGLLFLRGVIGVVALPLVASVRGFNGLTVVEFLEAKDIRKKN